MQRFLLALSVFLALSALSAAFSPSSALPLAGHSSRAVSRSTNTPMMFLAGSVNPSVLVAPGEPLTVVAGRGDKRTKKGKIFRASFGKVSFQYRCCILGTRRGPLPCVLWCF